MSENEFMIPNENILFSIDNSGEKLSPIGWYEVILCKLKRHMKKKRGRNQPLFTNRRKDQLLLLHASSSRCRQGALETVDTA